MDDRPLVLLVHGAWHGGWCWAALQADLDRRGVASMAVDLPGHGTSTLPLGDLYGDARHVADVVSAVGRPVVLVGHSYGGAVITEAAGTLHGVAALVFVAAFALERGESVTAMSRSSNRAVALNDAIRRLDDATLVIDPDGAARAFYGSSPPGAAAAAISRLCPQPIATFTQTITSDALRTIPSTYLLCREDEAIAPDLQRRMAARCRTTIELDADHSPFLSAVGETAAAVVSCLNMP